MSNRLQGKVALITGSTSGIGRATAKLFANEGARVVVNGRRVDWGNSLVQEIKDSGGEAAYFNGDLSNSQTVRDLVRFTVETYGHIDVLMNNAFHRVLGTVVELKEEDWDLSMAVTLKAPYTACQEAIPHMIRQGGGSIINTASVHSYLAMDRFFVYDVAKAGLMNMARQIAIDFGPYGIRANCVCPGRVIVERSEKLFEEDPDLETRVGLAYPLRRVARANEVAFAALYLASDESSFVTGTSIVVDGGMTSQLTETLDERYEAYFRSSFLVSERR